MSSSLGANLSIVQTRQDFTKDLSTPSPQAPTTLSLADTNEEGAKLLALQTRQQLSQTALTLSNQADQAVLRLF
jgi:flagellin